MLSSIPALLADTAHRFWASAPVQLWVWGFCAGFAIELLVARFAGRSVRHDLVNLSYGVLYLAAAFFLLPSIFTLTAAARDALGVKPLLDLKFLSGPGYLDEALTFLAYLFLIDFFQYWWHRAQHRFPWLWDQHVVHHSDELVNVTTANRHHWTELPFQAFTVALPFSLLFDVTPNAFGVIGAVFGAWPVFVHMNVRLSLGPLSWLIAAPQTHRIHHSIEREHRDKNFAAYFPIWDVIFGTYHHPRPDEFPSTGVQGVRLVSGWQLATAPFVSWFRRASAPTPVGGQQASRPTARPRGARPARSPARS